jgi:ribonucleoside-diphosphate reductase alpha chain
LTQPEPETSWGGYRPLPAERAAITHEFRVGYQKGTLIVSVYEDGNPGEVQVALKNAHPLTAGAMETSCMLISQLLQVGVSVDDVVKNLLNMRFDPSGPTDNPDIPIATSLSDYVGRFLKLKFGGGLGGELTTFPNLGFLPPCPDCGRQLKSDGGELICRNCGYNRSQLV